jgi:MYXO-CTERM domain-containing protein
VVRQVGHADKILAVRFSRDGKYIATGSADRALKIWDAASGQLLLSYDRNDDHVTAFDLLPTQPTALVGTRTGALYLLDLERGEPRLLEAKSDFMGAISVSADGTQAISGARGRAKLWDLATAKTLAELDTHGHPVEATAFTPHGALIALKGDRELELRSLESGKALFTAHTKGGVGAAVFSRDGKRLVVGGFAPYTIDIFDTSTFKKLVTLPGQHYEIADAAFSPDGKRLATCGRDATLNLWDVESAQLLHKWQFHDGLTSVDFAPDGGSIVVGAGQTLYKASSATVVDVTTSRILHELKGAEQVSVAAGISGDGLRVVTASSTEAVTFWSMETGAKVSAESLGNLSGVRGSAGFTLHDLKDAELSEDGNVVAAVGGGASYISQEIRGYILVRVQNVRTGKAQLLKGPAAGRIDDLALSADGRRVAVASWNGHELSSGDVWVWDVPSERLLTHLERKIRGDGVVTASVRFSHDGQHLFWGGDEDFQMINAETGVAERIFTQAPAVRAIALTNDERYVATSGEGLVVWDTRTGEKRPLGGSQAWRSTTPLAWLDNGQHLLATDGVSQLEVWDVAQNQITRAIPIASGGVRSLSVSRDGKRAVAASTDGTARVIDVPSGASAQLVAENGEWLMIDDQGYFDASKHGGDLVNLVSGLTPYRIDQLAARNNRPDRLLESLHAGSPDLIRHFHARYERRLERLGLTEAELSQPFAGAPQVSLQHAELAGASAHLSAHVQASTPLSSYQVYVNQVPTLGSQGAKLTGTSADLTLDVPLTPGVNRVELSATNAGGVESLRAEQRFELRSAAPARTLYFIAFGVSHYQNPKYDLGYAHKDALDLVEVARQMQGKLYARVAANAFVDEQVTRESLKHAKALLQGAKPEDTLVVFVAGHGGYSRDAAAEYYYLTHEADAHHLRETAAPFELVEDLVRDVQPRQKLLLLDTCSSGDRDPEDLQEASGGVPGSRGLQPRAIRALSLDLATPHTASSPRSYLFDRDRYIYTDLLRRTGAVVLSSSRGNEVSFETASAQNGLFTEEILRALTTPVADSNHNGVLDDRELRAYVASAVAAQSNQRQHPVVDTDNPDVRIDLPLVPEALAVLTRADPLAPSAQTASRGLAFELSAAASLQASAGVLPDGTPCMITHERPHGCGCSAVGERAGSVWSAALLLAAAAAVAAARRRRPYA